MKAVFGGIARLAKATFPVLVLGETGTGKEVIAGALHRWSSRARAPLVCINCGAIPQTLIESTLFGHERGAFTGADRERVGVFEEADGGVILLDEVGELSPSAQVALLRVIETGRIHRVGGATDVPVDVRIIAATHRDLEAMCAEGAFRRDLLYRLNTEVVQVPPLRQRPEDIEPLVRLFIDQANRDNGCRVRRVTPAALDRLRAYRWPGNVRELRNVIERAVVLATDDQIDVADLSDRIGREPADAAPIDPLDGEAATIGERVAAYEKRLILEALRATGGNQTRAAMRLGMPLRTLARKVRQYGLKRTYDDV